MGVGSRDTLVNAKISQSTLNIITLLLFNLSSWIQPGIIIIYQTIKQIEIKLKLYNCNVQAYNSPHNNLFWGRKIFQNLCSIHFKQIKICPSTQLRWEVNYIHCISKFISRFPSLSTVHSHPANEIITEITANMQNP